MTRFKLESPKSRDGSGESRQKRRPWEEVGRL